MFKGIEEKETFAKFLADGPGSKETGRKCNDRWERKEEEDTE